MVKTTYWIKLFTMNVNNLKPPRHDKAMSMWRGAGILMGNLVVITCIYGF